MHHRTWGVGLGAVCAVVVAGLLVTSAAAAPLVSSTFNRTAEGWLVAGDSTSATPTHVATGGNPGGYISAEDSVAGGVTYWVAPAKFRGDQGGAYGGLLTFSLRQDNASNQFDAEDVIIEGDGLTARTQQRCQSGGRPELDDLPGPAPPGAVHEVRRTGDGTRPAERPRVDHRSAHPRRIRDGSGYRRPRQRPPAAARGLSRFQSTRAMPASAQPASSRSSPNADAGPSAPVASIPCSSAEVAPQASTRPVNV